MSAVSTDGLQIQVPCLQYENRIFPLIGNLVTVGRESKAAIRIDTTFSKWETVSLQHACLLKRGERWSVRDGYSGNAPSDYGIYVNRKRTRVNYLNDNWSVGFGHVEFHFHIRIMTLQKTLKNVTDYVLCQSCDAFNRKYARFCRYCGNQIKNKC